MPDKEDKKPILDPERELPAPHDMLIEAEEKDGKVGDSKPEQSTTSKSQESSQKKALPLWLLPLISFLIVVIAGGMYFLNTQKETTKVAPSPAPTPTTTSTISCNPTGTPMTADWQIYKNALYAACIKYPSDMKIVQETDRTIQLYNANVDFKSLDMADYTLEVTFRNDSDAIKEFTLLSTTPREKDIPELHHADNAYVYKIRNFKVGEYEAVEYITDNTKGGGHETSYWHHFMVIKDDIAVYFRLGAGSKDEIQKLDPQFVQMVTSLVFKDEGQIFSNWKTYSNPKVGYSFHYPPNVLLNKPDDAEQLLLDVTERPIEDLNSPNGYGKEIAQKDMPQLANGSYGENFDWPLESSKEVIPLSGTNGKSFMVVSVYDVCSVTFRRTLVFYRKNHQIVISLIGNTDTLQKSMPEYFTTDMKGCVGPGFWKGAKAKDDFYKALKNGHGSEEAIDWFDTFDSMIDTITFN